MKLTKTISMIKTFLLIAFLLLTADVTAQINSIKEQLPEHPRLIFMKGSEKKVQSLIQKDKRMKKFHNYVIHYSDSILTFPCNERIKIGKRLLSVSRCNIKYILYLTYSYRMTGEKKYAERAKQELIKLSEFTDWNPSHFLDVAEMGLAAAIGYDWLYDYLDKGTKALVEKALEEKIIAPSCGKYAYNLRRHKNWNQVCNTGTSIAALAIYEKMPELTIRILNDAIKNLPIVMKEYAPDGAYIEGYNYWGYGTTYNVILIDLLQKLFGSDYGLKSQQGFMRTAKFHQSLVTPSLNYYNYGDNKDIPAKSISPAIFWFYKETGDQDLLYNSKQSLSLDKVSSDVETERFYPLALVWAAEADVSLKDIKTPKMNYYQGFGENPIVCFRSSWSDKNGAFIGFKGGNDRISHGHQDAGTFVYEADQVRWAFELGQEDYHKLEEAKLQLWDKDRWKIFRYNCFSHNIMTFDNLPIKENQFIPLDTIRVKADVMSCKADLSPLFEEQVENVSRTISLIHGKSCRIEDEIKCCDKDVVMCWRMVSEAERMTQLDDHTLLLHKGKKNIKMTVNLTNSTPTQIIFSLKPAKSENAYDSPNPNARFVEFQMRLKAYSNNKIQVTIGQ